MQNYYGVRCDPSLPYDPDFAAPPDAGRPSAVAKRRTIAVSRPNFIELCEELTASDERAFEDLFRRIGLSVDWTRTYATIDTHCRRVSQLAFLENLERGEAYQIEAPSLWDVTFQTAVAQAELDDREVPGAYHKLRFAGTGGAEDIWIDTTRPELVPSCVALVAHPDDGRYRPRFGSTVRTPVFDVEVPVVAHELADPDKGTGIAMICTFGDTADVTWWRELDLPVRTVIGRDGRLAAEPPAAVESPSGRAAYARLAGKTAVQARTEIAAVFAESGDIDGEPRPITHPVKFFEKGDKPLEIVSSRQWYIRNGGRDDDLRNALIDRGNQMNWVPGYMRARYESWIAGLSGGLAHQPPALLRRVHPAVVPPRRRRLAGLAQPDPARPRHPAGGPVLGLPARLRRVPAEGRPGGFAGDPDVMDTWATSSLTPQIATGWRTDEALYASTFPMDMRPQAHDIIRTWLFSTVVRAHFDAGTVPWYNCALSGWILDPDRKKMSKSRGNVQVPTDLLERYGADAVPLLAPHAADPAPTPRFDEQQFRIGRRLAVKLLNASKFVLRFAELDDEAAVEVERREQALRTGLDTGAVPAGVTELLDRSMLHRLADLVDEATRALDAFDYARALERTESFFWSFTDDHHGIGEGPGLRGARARTPSVSARLRAAEPRSSVLQQLFAPFMPFVAEEVWRWWHDGRPSMRRRGPSPSRLRAAAGRRGGAARNVVAAAVLGEVRRAKSEAKRPLRTEVLRAEVADTAERIAVLQQVAADVCAAGRIAGLVTAEGSELSVACELAPEAAA